MRDTYTRVFFYQFRDYEYFKEYTLNIEKIIQKNMVSGNTLMEQK